MSIDPTVMLKPDQSSIVYQPRHAVLETIPPFDATTTETIKMKNKPHTYLTLAGRAACFAITAMLTMSWQAQAQPVIAHWSFDAATLSTSGGNITNVADSTGNHDAFVSPTAGNYADNTPIISATFPVADSVAGQFGEGLRFNGDNYLVFSNLSELQYTAGGSDYTVSMWVKWLSGSGPGGEDRYNILSSWGNGPAGGAGNDSSHPFAFGVNGAAQFALDVQYPVGADAEGERIINEQTGGLTPAINDGNWHMITWTFNITSGELRTYYDGVFQEAVTSTAPSFIMADNTSPTATIGLKGDTAQILNADTYLDEIWVIGGVLDSNEVAQLYTENVLFSPGNELTWQGGANDNWDTNSLNWLTNGGPATTFATGDLVRFDDTATGPTNIDLTISPKAWSLTVSNDSLDYTFTGSGGIESSSAGLTKQGSGKLTLANSCANSFGGSITIEAGTIQVGNGGADGGLGSGNVANDGSLVFNRTGSLTANNTISGTGSLMQIGSGTVTLTKANTYSGSTIISGGTLELTADASLANSSEVVVANATFDVSAPAPLVLGGNLAITNGAIGVGLAAVTDAVTTPTLSVNGANTINVGSMPDLLTYPQQFTAIKYTTLNGAPNFALGTLPPTLSVPYSGYVSNNTGNDSIDVVITNGPTAITWVGYSSGSPNSSWDTSTPNWKDTGGSPTSFIDGQPVAFDDTASNSIVSLDLVVSPDGITASNSVLNYTFNGANYISGAGVLTKQGSGTLTLNNAGVNDFTGGVEISGGTLQVGNSDFAGNLPATGSVVNDAALVFARADDVTVPNVISGSGSVSHTGASILTLGGINTFDGAVTIASGSTLRAGNNSALGSTVGTTTIQSGGTLELNSADVGQEHVFVSGTGVSGLGAIYNSGGDENNALELVTLTGHAKFGGTDRWDIRDNGSGAALSTAGNSYNLSIATDSDEQVSLVSVVVDPALGDIEIQAGGFSVENNTTSLGNPASTLTVSAGGRFAMYNTTNQWDKVFVVDNGATVHSDSGANTIIGPMSLPGSGGFHTFDTDGGSTLTLNNVLTGGGLIYKVDTGTLVIVGNSPSFTGGGYFLAGTVTLSGTLNNNLGVLNDGALFNINGTLSGAGGVTNYSGTVAGGGTVGGAVQIAGGALVVGNAGTAGTLTVGGLDLGTVTLTNDLSSVGTVGGGVNDLIVVNGDLTMNANEIYINPIGAGLASSYTLATYTGSFSGSLGTVALIGASRYTLTLTNVTTASPKRIDLIVSGGNHQLEWNNAGASGEWDVLASQNWTNLTAGLSPDFFYTADSVRFTDSILSQPSPMTTIGLNTTVVPSVMTVNSTTNYTIGGAGKISGGASIVKQGSSTLTLNNANDFSGTVVVEAGTLLMGNNAALGSTIGTTTIESGATLNINNKSFQNEPVHVSGTGVGGNGAIVNTGASQGNAVGHVVLKGDVVFSGPNRWDIRNGAGILSSEGNAYNIIQTNVTEMAIVNINVDTNIADIHISGIWGVEGSTTGMGNPTNTLYIHGPAGGQLRFHELNPHLNKRVVAYGNATRGSGNNTIRANSGEQNTFIGEYIELHDWVHFAHGGGDDLTVMTPITGTGNIKKTGGSGELRLHGTNTYTGETYIDSGDIFLVGNGSIRFSTNIFIDPGEDIVANTRTDQTLSLASGQTISGGGRVQGNLTTEAGSTVSPGDPAGDVTQTLQAANPGIVNLGGTCLMEIDGTASDKLIAVTNTFGGTLTVAINGAAPTGGEVYDLFDGVLEGSFAVTNLPALGAGLVWDTTQLGVDGTLSVVATVNTTPTDIITSVAGDQMTLSWPLDHTGWRLLVQTNLLSTGLSTNWIEVTDSALTNEVTVTIDPSSPSVFYQLVYP